MTDSSNIILGEVLRSLDDRHRVSIPAEMVAPLTTSSPECMLAKERPGCLSLWSRFRWRAAGRRG